MREFFCQTLPGRWETLRDVRDDEIDSTAVFRLSLDQVAAKVRNEFSDHERYMPETPIWTGTLPCSTVFRSPVPDSRFPLQTLPDYLEEFVGKPAFSGRVDGAR
jgi:hypothetical protein